GDVLEAFAACARGRLAQAPPLRIGSGAAMTVVAAAAGYPEAYEKGHVIEGLAGNDDRGNSLIFHAGTAADADGTLRTHGGRVLAVTGLGDTLAAAREAAYATLDGIRFPGMFHRKDIGARGLALATEGER
ncbi:MAG: phosphoribosylamine--glycine ligase, partial [Gemmatimonadetes bacterium]|nr:phosphoribosylamine--glycine ligase [Gemmatimonadota bacterium]